MSGIASLRVGVAGCALAVSFAPVDIGYGLIVFQLLGHGYDGLGVASGWIAVLISTVLVSAMMRTGHLFTSVRPAQTLSTAALLALVLADMGQVTPAQQAVIALSTVMVCTALAGVIQLAMGFANVGRLVSFVPRPVLSGVASAAAIGLAIKAVKSLWGLYAGSVPAGLQQSANGLLTVLEASGAPQLIVWPLFIVTALSVMTWAARKLVFFNWSLIGLLFGTGLFWLLDLVWPAAAGGPDLGQRLPPLSIPAQAPLFLQAWQALAHPDTLSALLSRSLPYAFVVAVINSLEALVYNARFERSTEIAHSPRGLLIALGAGNALGGALGGLPVSLSSTKMTLAWQSGVRTQAGVAAHTIMLLVLVLTTAWYVHWVPKIAVSLVMLYLAWVMLDAWSRQQLRGWLDPQQFVLRLRSPQSTPVIFAVVILVALLSNLAWGVAIGLAAAVFVFVQRQSRSVIKSIDSLANRRSVVMRNTSENECVERQAGRVLVVELQGALFFGTSEQMLRALRTALVPQVSLVVLDGQGVMEVDDSGCETLERLQSDLLKRGGALVLCGWDERVQWRSQSEIIQLKRVMKGPFFRTLDEASEYAEDWLIEHYTDAEQRLAFCEFDPSGKTLQVFSRMDDTLREVIMGSMQRISHETDAVLFRRKEPSDALYVLMSGRVDIWINHGKPDALRLASFRPGVTFGEMGLLRDEPRTADAITVGEVLALKLTREAFEHMREHQPAALAQLLVALSQELSDRLYQTNRVLRRALM